MRGRGLSHAAFPEHDNNTANLSQNQQATACLAGTWYFPQLTTEVTDIIAKGRVKNKKMEEP